MNKDEIKAVQSAGFNDLDHLIEFAKSVDPDATVTEFPEPTNVLEALNHLMGRVGYVQKTASDGLPYTFASEPEFIRAVRPHMVDLGLTIHPIKQEHIETVQYLTARGAQAFNRVFRVTFRITHSPTKEHLDVQTIGEGTDYGDKSCNKAMTVALKYALRQSLLIETGDDPDQFNSDDFVADKTSKTKPRPKSSGGPRVENQWEDDALKIVDTVYGKDNEVSRPHVVNMLNHSIFFKTVPYGELTAEDALAYVLAWQVSKEKYPDDTTEERAERINKNWSNIETGFRDEAIEYIRDDDELFDSGLGYGDL
jgi:hypothetical protein